MNSIDHFIDDRPVASVAHALGVPQQEWGQLLKLIQQQTQVLRRLRRSLAEVRDAAQELLEISPEDEEEARKETLNLGQEVLHLMRERAAAEAALADKAVVLQEIARLRDLLTPRVYKEGDRPSLPEMVLWLPALQSAGGVWAPLHRDCLQPGDLWLPMPPPPVEK